MELQIAHRRNGLPSTVCLSPGAFQSRRRRPLNNARLLLRMVLSFGQEGNGDGNGSGSVWRTPTATPPHHLRLIVMATGAKSAHNSCHSDSGAVTAANANKHINNILTQTFKWRRRPLAALWVCSCGVQWVLLWVKFEIHIFLDTFCFALEYKVCCIDGLTSSGSSSCELFLP